MIKETIFYVYLEVAGYLADYGGAKAIFGSPFFLLALLISLISLPSIGEGKWLLRPSDVLPDILGFTLGAYAIIITGISGNFRDFLISKDECDTNISPYLSFNLKFIHFIFIQTIAILSSLLVESIIEFTVYFNMDGILSSALFIILEYIVSLLFLYSISLVFATALAVLRIVKFYEKYIKIDTEN